MNVARFGVGRFAWSVKVRLVPKYGPDSTITATRISGNDAFGVWQATTALPLGITAVQAQATAP